METDYRKQRYLANPGIALFSFWITILSIANSVLLVFPIALQSKQVVVIVEIFLSILLLVDFLALLRGAPNRRRYFLRGMGWMDFLGSIPVPFARVLRLIPMVITGRQLRRGDAEAARQAGQEQRAKSTLFGFVLVAIIIFETAAILVLEYEFGAPGASIVTGEDALWWSFVTVTTVGYGDMVPVTTGGRLVGIALMTVGIGLFSVITSFMADWFRRSRGRAVAPPASGARTTLSRSEHVAMLRQLIDEQEQHHRQTMAALREQLERIEAAL